MSSKQTQTPFLPLMMVELAMAASETIFHRTWLMATGQCSPMEYQRMVLEKLKAAQLTGLHAMSSSSAYGPALLAPWHRAARSNARRLRRS